MLLMAMVTGASAVLACTTTQPVPDLPSAAKPPDAVAHVALTQAPARLKPVPVRIVIPAIGVGAGVEILHRGTNGTLNTPEDWNHTGWFADGTVPGDRGPAVIVGHVDSARDGPAVFYRLPQVRPGDDVMIETSDGGTQRFVVESTRQFPKTAFPTGLVYGPTPLPELHLITCTGRYDPDAHNYLDNLVVTAYAASIPRR
jgi:sortase (surface protein transpeptidase)